MNYFNQKSERIIFRKLTESDIEGWKEFFDNNDRLHYLGLDLSKDINTMASEWIHRQLGRYENEGLGLLAAIEKNTGKLIGMSGIIPRQVLDRDLFEIAYSLMPPEWGKGYGTEMALQMKKFGLENKIAEHYISIIHKENKESMHVAEKNGMHIIGETTFMEMEVFVFGTGIL